MFCVWVVTVCVRDGRGCEKRDAVEDVCSTAESERKRERAWKGGLPRGFVLTRQQDGFFLYNNSSHLICLCVWFMWYSGGS